MQTIGHTVPETLQRKLALQQALNALLARCVPPALRTHCTAIDLQNRALVVAVGSSAIRTRLRLGSAEIIREFNRLNPKHTIDRIQLVTAPSVPLDRKRRASAPRGPTERVPKSTARALRLLADETDDPALADALRRIARHSGDHGD